MTVFSIENNASYDRDWNLFQKELSDIETKYGYLVLLLPVTNKTRLKPSSFSNFIGLTIFCSDSEGNIHAFCNDNYEMFGYCFINCSDPYCHGKWMWYDTIDELVDEL